MSLHSAAIRPRGWWIGSPIQTVFTMRQELVREAAALGCFSIARGGFSRGSSARGESGLRSQILEGKSRCRCHGDNYPTLFRQ